MTRLIATDHPDAIKFWGILDFDKRCAFIEHLEVSELTELFKSMPIAERT